MDRPIIETFTNERGNIEVRVSQEVVVLTKEQQIQLRGLVYELRKLVKSLLECHTENDADTCANCEFRSPLHGGCMADVRAQELGIETGDDRDR